MDFFVFFLYIMIDFFRRHRYNGEFGCFFCLSKGESVPVGRGFTRMYPGDVGLNRTLAQHEVDC